MITVLACETRTGGRLEVCGHGSELLCAAVSALIYAYGRACADGGSRFTDDGEKFAGTICDMGAHRCIVGGLKGLMEAFPEELCVRCEGTTDDFKDQL